MSVQQTFEVNFDGLIGPTHNYSGLSFGNIASVQHKNLVSNPREAALQGRQIMWHVRKLGLEQAVLPPHERPHLSILRKLGFGRNDHQVIQKAFQTAPQIFVACCSASSMWTA